MSDKKGNVVAVICLIIFVLTGAYAICKLYVSYAEYEAGEKTYEMIADRVIVDDASDDIADESVSIIKKAASLLIGEDISQTKTAAKAATETIRITVPERTIDYDELNSISPNAIGWLYCPDTVIDYPVMKSEDYKYYLTHLPDDTYNKNGSLFLDYSCETDFTGSLSVIYGHCMKTGSMFGTLSRYKKQSYYDEHPYLYLYTKEQNYRIALIYGAVVAADKWISEDFVNNTADLLKYAKENTTFSGEVQYSAADSFIVLSTCSYEFTDARYFVIGVLQKEQ